MGQLRYIGKKERKGHRLIATIDKQTTDNSIDISSDVNPPSDVEEAGQHSRLESNGNINGIINEEDYNSNAIAPYEDVHSDVQSNEATPGNLDIHTDIISDIYESRSDENNVEEPVGNEGECGNLPVGDDTTADQAVPIREVQEKF